MSPGGVAGLGLLRPADTRPTAESSGENLYQGDGRVHADLQELLALRHQVSRLATGARARATISGQHLSRTHARGMDYAESRIYQAGDDIRVMDWRLLARTGKPHTKLFLEERGRDLVVLLDMNASMQFGTRRRFKSVQALRAAALAAWMTVAGADRAGAQVFGKASGWVRPRGGTRGVLGLLGELLRHDRNPGDDNEQLSQALGSLAQRIQGGSRVLVISDGFSCDPAAGKALRRLQAKADVAVLGICDALERHAPAVNRLPVEQDGRRWTLPLDSRASRETFLAAMGRGRRQLDGLCHQHRLRIQWLDTAGEPQVTLRALLQGGLRGRTQ